MVVSLPGGDDGDGVGEQALTSTQPQRLSGGSVTPNIRGHGEGGKVGKPRPRSFIYRLVFGFPSSADLCCDVTFSFRGDVESSLPVDFAGCVAIKRSKKCTTIILKKSRKMQTVFFLLFNSAKLNTYALFF